MPIPSFDRYGNLDVGDLFGSGAIASLAEATLQEMHDRFVASAVHSAKRDEVWAGWMRHRSELEATGIGYTTLIGGSFLTTRKDPSDIDFLVLLDADEVNRLDPATYAQVGYLLRGPATKKTHKCDAYPLLVYPFSTPRFVLTIERLTYWTRVFGIDRDRRHRTILLINQRGVI